MSRQKLRVVNTQLDNLVSNLRGEVGEVVTSWVLLRHIMASERGLFSDDPAKDMANENLAFISMLREKLSDEIIARLSELAEPKIGRLTFHFAAVKLGQLDEEVRRFNSFISRNRFQEKRNYDISHKELPEEWSQHQMIVIPYRTVLKGIAMALRLMKRIDRIVLGPSAVYLWPEMRKKRYRLMNPASAAYMMMPHFNLSPEIRGRVIADEMAEGRAVWTDMKTTINGQEVTVSACREWGAFLLGGRMVVLDQYPLQALNSIEVPEAKEGAANDAFAGAEPITEQKTITAKYRVIRTDDGRVTFEPVRRVQPLEGGGMTELVNIDIVLGNEKLKEDFGAMKIGDEKEFTLTVTVLTGYRHPDNGPTGDAAVGS